MTIKNLRGFKSAARVVVGIAGNGRGFFCRGLHALILSAGLAFVNPAFGAWTEFYVQPTGSNLNAGSTTADAATFTYAGGTFVRATRVFTVASGNPQSDGVAAGNWASVYTTAGATVATYVGRVTAADATTITIHATAIAGATTTVSESAGAATCKIGGAWAGPSGAVDFPIGFAAGTMQNASSNRPRVNIKGDGDDTTADYNITATMTADITGIIQFQGYTTTPGDGGRAFIDGGTSGVVTYYNLLLVSGALNTFADLIFAHNGGTGSAADGININTAETCLYRCVVHDVQRDGVRIASRSHLIECEGYACNQANSAGFAAFGLRADGAHAFRCIAHDNIGANVDGFASGGAALVECISDSNGRNGFSDTGDKSNAYLQCDAYNNGADGIKVGTGTGSMLVTIENCNLIKNGGWGINFNAATMVGALYNNRFGAGTQANTSGTFSTQDGLDQIGNSSYASNVTPWVDPANGDFRITLAAAKNAGRGSFTQTSGSYAGAAGYPDIGAAQHQESAGAARSYRLRLPTFHR